MISPLICEVCGQVHPHNIYLCELNMLICPDCAAQRYKCPTCETARLCDFETNPSSIPKIIQKQIRQGNMISVVTTKNPERIEITCKKNCPCFNHEKQCCNKELYGECDNYHLINSPHDPLLDS